MIGEIGDAEQRALAELMWEKTRDTLLVVEPGTPAGYARIIALRERLIALGAHVAAPCPHDGKCPLQAPDWCHFTQRLQRSRAHKQVKGAELPFEDERFSYVALTRAPVAQRPSRVLAQPASARSKWRQSFARRKASPSQRCRAGPRRITPQPGAGAGAMLLIDRVIPGWSEGPDLRCAIAHRGISRFRVRCFASPRNDGRALALNLSRLTSD